MSMQTQISVRQDQARGRNSKLLSAINNTAAPILLDDHTTQEIRNIIKTAFAIDSEKLSAFQKHVDGAPHDSTAWRGGPMGIARTPAAEKMRLDEGCSNARTFLKDSFPKESQQAGEGTYTLGMRFINDIHRAATRVLTAASEAKGR